MVSLQSALLPEAAKRPPCLSLVVGGGVVASTATSKKRKRDGRENSRGVVVEEDGIELNFDAAPLPPEWQRCLDIQSGRIHYYNTRTQKRTRKDPRAEPGYRAVPATAADEDDAEEDSANCGPAGLDLDLNLTFQPRRPVVQPKNPKQPASTDRRARSPPVDHQAEDGIGREMFAAVCGRCHMLVMMCRASPACPNCKFLHSPTSWPAPALKLGLQLLCCRD